MAFLEIIVVLSFIFFDLLRKAKIFGIFGSFTAMFALIFGVTMQAAECVGVLIVQAAVLQRTNMEDMVRAQALTVSYHIWSASFTGNN
jgi:hypothetical protein